jgi:hypothetical protein
MRGAVRSLPCVWVRRSCRLPARNRSAPRLIGPFLPQSGTIALRCAPRTQSADQSGAASTRLQYASTVFFHAGRSVQRVR